MKPNIKKKKWKRCQQFNNSYSQAIQSGRVFVLKVMPKKTNK